MSSTDGLAQAVPAVPRPRIDRLTSDRIKAARVICILALVFVHVPPWVPQLGTPPRDLAAFDYAFVFLQEALSRTSVPLLSVLSGYLLVATEAGGRYVALLRRKARSLLLPLLLWNLLSLLLRLVVGEVEPASPMGWLNRLLAVNGMPLILPLYFLRDIFLCVVVFPLLAWLLRRWAGTTVFLLVALAVAGVLDAVLINPLILAFFAVGCALGMGTFPIKRLPPAAVTGAAFVVVALVATAAAIRAVGGGIPGYVPHGDWDWPHQLLLFTQRAVGAMVFWHLAGLLVRSAWARAAMAIEPFVFFLFCSHTLVLGAAWRLLVAAGVDYGEPAYAVFYFTAPLTCFIVAVGAATALLAVAPGLLKPLCGGRLPAWNGFGRAPGAASA